MVESFRGFQYQGRQSGPHLVITAGVHGDEFESISAVQQLVRMFEQNHADVQNLNGRVSLVPIVNESAFGRGHRCGQDGLDLARTCPGKVDGSVTEQTALQLSELIQAADYYIDLHTGGTEYAVYPLVGYTLHQNAKVLES